MSWLLKYKVVRIVPGVIVAPWGEHIDLSNPGISEDKIKRLHESGCPYLQPIEPLKKVEVPQAEKQVPTQSSENFPKKNAQSGHQKNGNKK